MYVAGGENVILSPLFPLSHEVVTFEIWKEKVLFPQKSTVSDGCVNDYEIVSLMVYFSLLVRLYPAN